MGKIDMFSTEVLKTKLQLEICNVFNENLKTEWNTLEDNSNITPFQTFYWQKKWFDTIGSKRNIQPFIIKVYLNYKCIAIFPFCMKKKYLKVIYWNGGIQTDYNLPLINYKYYNNENLNIIWTNILDKIKPYDLIMLNKLPEFINGNKNLLIDMLKKKYLTSSYQLILNNKNLEKLKNKKIIKDNKRQIRRLSKLGNLKFIIAENKEERKEIIEKMIFQKSQRYITTNSWDMFSEKENIIFYTKLNKNLNKISNFHYSCIKLNNEIIATHLGFYDRKNFYYLMPSFDINKYHSYSPGKILIQYLIEWAIKNNLEIFDFTVGNEYYKKLWSNNSFNIFDYEKAGSFIGKIIIILNNYKKLIRHIPFSRNIYNFFIRF